MLHQVPVAGPLPPRRLHQAGHGPPLVIARKEHLLGSRLPARVGVDIDLDLRLESVSEGVLATGVVSAELVGECSRCLGEVREERDFDLQELYYYPGRDAEEDALFVVDEYIDLDPPMRDAIVLELPFTPLCREDCLGLCPICGFNLNDDPEHNHGEQIDPRWEGLELFKAD